MRIKIELQSYRKKYELYFFVHESHGRAQRAIEDGFYETGSENPEGRHFEFKVLSEDILKHVSSEEVTCALHVHYSKKDGLPYVCWSRILPDLPLACAMLKAWCVGTIFSIENDIDFAEVLGRQSIEDDDFEQIEEFFQSQHEIEVFGIEEV